MTLNTLYYTKGLSGGDIGITGYVLALYRDNGKENGNYYNGPMMICLILVRFRIWGFPKIRGTFLGVPIIRT